MSKGLSFRGARQSALRTLALWVAQIALVLYFLYCVQAASYMRGKVDGLAEAPPASTATSLQEATIADAPGQAIVSMTDQEHEALVAASKTPKGLTFAKLQAIGVARVSLPSTAMQAHIQALRAVFARVRAADGIEGYEELLCGFGVAQRLLGRDEIFALEEKYMARLVGGAAG